MAIEGQQNKPAHNTEEKVRRGFEETAEQARHTGLTGVQTSEEVVRAAANLFQQNAEIVQNSWRIGLDLMTTILGRSTDQVSRAIGGSGDGAQEATKRSARNAEGILRSAAAVSKGMNEISTECLQLARSQLEYSINEMNELWRCRTPQDFTAVQMTWSAE